MSKQAERLIHESSKKLTKYCYDEKSGSRYIYRKIEEKGTIKSNPEENLILDTFAGEEILFVVRDPESLGKISKSDITELRGELAKFVPENIIAMWFPKNSEIIIYLEKRNGFISLDHKNYDVRTNL